MDELWLGKLVGEQLRPYDENAEPQPIHLHWTWLLILSIVLGYWTGALFIDFWLVLQANWIRRATGQRLGLTLALWILSLDFLRLGISLLARITIVRGLLTGNPFADYLSMVLALAMLALYLGAIFEMRRDMENEPIGLATGLIMTFFFGPYYFQYWLQDYVFVRLDPPRRTDVPATSPEPSP